MRRLAFHKIFFFILLFSLNSFSQNSPTMPVSVDIISEDDLTPGVMRALPD